MSDSNQSAIDFVRELRLRQWARQHYVTIDLRKSTWHPVVLDEMSRRDYEQLEEIAAETLRSGKCTESFDSADYTESEQSSQFEECSHSAWDQPGSAYVPLAPSGDWRLHTAETGVRKPHFTAAFVTSAEDIPDVELTSSK